jgi:hypothetical protein
VTTEWFEHRSKCSLCGWIGSSAEITERKQMGFAKFFDVCPGCGEWKYNRKLLSTSKTGRPIYSHTSCLAGYAVHKECGRWHKPGTECAP